MVLEEYLPEAAAEDERFEGFFAWKGGALAGFVAAAVTAVLLLVLDPDVLSRDIAGMYGIQENLAVGFGAHLVHGTLFGVLFAVILWEPVLFFVSSNRVKSALAGLVFGLILAVGAAGIVLPIWLQIADVSSPPELPYITTELLVWHIAYGLVLGLLFPYVDDI